MFEEECGKEIHLIRRKTKVFTLLEFQNDIETDI